MRKASLWSLGLSVATLLALPGCGSMGSPRPATLGQVEQPSGFTASVKRGFSKVKDAVTPDAKPQPEVDVLSLSRKPKDPGAELYVSMAALAERSGNFKGAEEQYVKALEEDPNHLEALLGYAHLLDRQGKLMEATKHYEQAAKSHPLEAAAHNDLGLCYARRGLLNQSVDALAKAVELEPTKTLYRNNIATVLVQLDRTDKAIEHLSAAHGEAVAHHNVGVLLRQKGDVEQARQQFTLALQKSPNLMASRQALGQLGDATANTGTGTTTTQLTSASAPTGIPAATSPSLPRQQATAPVLRYPGQAASSAVPSQAPLAPMPEGIHSAQQSPQLRLLPAVR